MFGYVIKISEENYIVNVDPLEKGSGYGVVPKQVDPFCKYDFDEVLTYYENTPDKRLSIDHSIVTYDIPIEQEIREQRDFLIQEVEWRVNRHQQEVMLDIPRTEELYPLLEYIQALRDVPQQEGFPTDVEWPVPPWEEEALNG
jgi:hypothetical protein